MGLKVTVMVQLAPVPTPLPQVLISAKSPLSAMLLTVNGMFPVLVSITAWPALELPTVWAGKVKLPGETVTPEAALVPFRTIACGLLGAPSVMVMLPIRAPVAVGVKVMLTAQAVCTARLVPQVLLWAKSPLAMMLDIAKGAGPGFHTVTVCAALVVPKGWLAKVTLLGLSAMTIEFK